MCPCSEASISHFAVCLSCWRHWNLQYNHNKAVMFSEQDCENLDKMSLLLKRIGYCHQNCAHSSLAEETIIFQSSVGNI